MIDDDGNELMYQSEVAREYRIPEGTLRHWRSADKGPPSFRLGSSGTSRVMYRRSEVDRWFAAVEKETRRGDHVDTATDADDVPAKPRH